MNIQKRHQGGHVFDGLQVGGNGTPLRKLAVYDAVKNLPAAQPTSTAVVSVTVEGVSADDELLAVASPPATTGRVITAGRVTAADTVEIQVANVKGVTLVATSGTVLMLTIARRFEPLGG